MMTALGVLCLLGVLILLIVGGCLTGMVDDEVGPGVIVGAMLSTAFATVGLLVLGIRCFVGHW